MKSITEMDKSELTMWGQNANDVLKRAEMQYKALRSKQCNISELLYAQTLLIEIGYLKIAIQKGRQLYKTKFI